jgi:hypothetical protein
VSAHRQGERLRQVYVEARLVRPLSVLLLAVAGHRRQHQRAAFGLGPQLLRHVVAGHLRQTDVKQDDLRLKRAHRWQHRRTVVHRADLVAPQAQKHRGALGHVHVIVHDQHAPYR